MDKNCVDNAHKADWIREMNKMEHDCDEQRKDDRFPMTGWPYYLEEDKAKSLAALQESVSALERESAYQTQVSGSHYAKYAIQPTDYIIKNKLNFCEGNVIKYVTRWRDKGGKDDLLKAKHYIDMLIETEGL